MFARHGYDSTTIRMIAEESGISLGLLYNYFQGKEAVLKVIVDSSVADIKKSLKFPDEFSRPEKKFEYLVEQIFESVHKNLAFYKVFFAIRMQPAVQKFLSKELSSLNSLMLNILENMLAELGISNHKHEAQLLHACIDGCSNHYVLHSRTYPVEEMKKAILKRYKI